MPDAAPVVRIPRQLFGEEALLVEEPPEQERDDRRDRNQPPARSERERGAEQVQEGARVHGMADDGIWPRRDHALIVLVYRENPWTAATIELAEDQREADDD